MGRCDRPAVGSVRPWPRPEGCPERLGVRPQRGRCIGSTPVPSAPFPAGPRWRDPRAHALLRGGLLGRHARGDAARVALNVLRVRRASGTRPRPENHTASRPQGRTGLACLLGDRLEGRWPVACPALAPLSPSTGDRFLDGGQMGHRSSSTTTSPIPPSTIAAPSAVRTGGTSPRISQASTELPIGSPSTVVATVGAETYPSA